MKHYQLDQFGILFLHDDRIFIERDRIRLFEKKLVQFFT